jgi:hypothetical protein
LLLHILAAYRLQLTTAGAAGSTLGGDNVEFFLLKMVYVKGSFKFGPFKMHFMKIKIEKSIKIEKQSQD